MKLWIFAVAIGICLPAAEREPMAVNYKDSASYRWLNKPVLASRVLDDMEKLEGWTAFTTGAPQVVDARVASTVTESKQIVARMTLTGERSRDGGQSLRLRMPTRMEGPGPVNGRGWGSAGIKRTFGGEDWRGFNRISLWIYSDNPGAYSVSLSMRLSNDGVEKLPAAFGQEGEHTVNLRNLEWNHVVWEIGNVARDRVTGLTISRGMSGNEPESPETVTFDFDRLELERVEPDYVEGWGVWPGRISYSHAGYQAGATKTAIASDLKAREFRVIDQATGQTALSKAVETVTTRLGVFQVMDFSAVRGTGSYVLEAGGAATQPFRIELDVWRQTIFKALNCFAVQRCGAVVPGVHGVCHRDWTVLHNGERIVINGGWHDAGDLTQGLSKTGEIVYGMFSLAERLEAGGDDPELYDRVMEEARWGLDWVMKTSFGDGYRDTGSVNSRRTNGILGDDDDVTAQANNWPAMNFVASAAEAIAARALKRRDPRLAAYALKMAEADWRFAVAGLADPAGASVLPTELFRGTLDSDNVAYDAASSGVAASVDLWRATGNKRYADKAAELARVIMDSQQRKRPAWNIPFTGFFYTGPAKERLAHYVHQGHEQGPALAMRMLCEAFPDHPDWMKWYSAAALHSEYLKAMAKFTEPYGVMPASIYTDQEYRMAPEATRDGFQKQVLNGVPLGAGHYLKLFPVWMSYRGHFGTVLPQTQALANAAQLRGDLDAEQLAQKQLEWVIGRNPFSQSAMYGEGHDFAPLDTPSSGDMVGGIPVGIQTRGNADVPYWPVQNTWTYKEIWVHPVGRWIWLMRDLAGPAIVEGVADAGVEFRDAAFGQRVTVQPDGATGRFRVRLPEGKYVVRSGGEEQTRVFLPGARYGLDLRAGRSLDFDAAGETSAAGEVTIRVRARGSGRRVFSVRTDNLAVEGATKELVLQAGAGSVEWKGRMGDRDSAWVAVVSVEGDPGSRKEVMGAVWGR